jgi:DNA polymerase I
LDHQLKNSGYDAKIIHILHDEVIVEAREDIAEDVKGIVKRCMESAMGKMVPGVPFIVEPRIRNTWGN